MKKSSLILGLVFLTSTFQLIAQNSSSPKPESIVYTIGYNKVPDKCNIPLIGFINVAKGSYTGLQIGFANTTASNFNGLGIGFANTIGSNKTGALIGFFNTIGSSSKGLDVGFFNTIGNSGSGIEVGFFNTLGSSFHGIQTGFFNTLGSSANGAQIGFFNTLGSSMHGLQVGFFNTLGKEADGIQVGFSNILGGSMKGIQIGFSNIDGKEAKGIQLGFFNRTPELSGIGIGFLNVVDTVKTGVPIGFLSFVKKGGYQALEIGTNEMFPVNIAYKTGIKQFYTSLLLSYSPISHNHYAIGMGIGSFVPLNSKLSFNPELLSQTTCTVSWDQIYSLHLNFDYKLSDKLSIAAGPTVVWNHLQNGTILHEPVFAIYQNELDANNKLLVGLNVALRYQL
ncbi:MAG: hypothetical protein PHR83_07590 [Paludibacter sp.]|nr:hypothetical protein [Paludibacter sp.]